ncbi:MAG: lysine--tRNA ligase [Armatimonadota bacterium]|nr:lysine--tRNA ligase [Armatimonadota bacterium]
MSDQTGQREVRLRKLEAMREEGIDPFAATGYERTHRAGELQRRFDELEGETVAVAGRLTALREHGRSAFADLMDASGGVQLFMRQNTLGEQRLAEFVELDIGDIVGARGTLMRTRTGEVSVEASQFEVLAKSLRPLPEKFHGLQDPELRYRQRYLDLIVNPDAREMLQKRSHMVARLRQAMSERGYTEFQTPVLQPIYGGAHARPFTTYHNTLDMTLYLRIAPELYLKRLLVGGFERVYEIGPCFRNEGVDARHNPEFTMLEAYQAYADWEDMMELMQGLVVELAEAVCGGTSFTYREHEVDVTPPFRRVKLLHAVEEATGVDFAALQTDEQAREACAELDLGNTEADSWGTLLEKSFDRYVQPELVQPTFVTEYPTRLSPLAKRMRERPDTAYRFELFAGTEEIGNAFSELNDPLDQRRRFEEQAAAREAGDAEAPPLDEDFVRALEHGMPPAGGMGMGVDRLAMLLLDAPNLREVLAFPLLRPRDGD